MTLYFNESEYKGDYETSVLRNIEGAIESWEFENEIEVSQDETYELVQEFCRALVSASSNPLESESLLQLYAKTKIQIESCEDYDGPDFDEFVEAELAKISVNMIASAANNMWELFAILTQIQKAPIPEIPLNYLKRVFRCYIWGLKPECVILCRSVLDVAIDEKIPDKLCAKYLNPNKEDYTLGDKLKTIKQSKLFNKELIDLLYRVKHRGDKCIHGDMDIVQDIKGTVVDTCKALIAICEVKL